MNTALAEKRHQLCKEAFGATLTTGEVIAHFEKGQRSPVLRKALIKLLGGDMERMWAAQALAVISTRYEDGASCFTDVMIDGLNGLTKREAIQFYSLFPRTLTPSEHLPDCQEDADELVAASHLYLGTALWLLNWQRGDRFSQLLMKQLGLEAEQKRAWVTRARMQLCDYLAANDEHPVIQDLSPAALWLLLEIAFCRSHLSARPTAGTKRAYIRRRSEIIDRLGSTDPAYEIKTRPAKDVPELVENFDSFFQWRLKEMSKADKNFDNVLYAQYLKAEKAWGRTARDVKGISTYL